MRPKLGFQKSRTIDSSPVSVINVLRSNTSFVSSSSSASASANRSSFASDLHDRDSDACQHLAGHSSGGESLSGLDPDPDKDLVHKLSGFTDTTHCADKVVQKQDSHSDAEEDLSTDSTPVSSSLALKDSQDGRSKGNVHRKKWSPRHQVYVKVETSSPRLETFKNNSYPSRPSSSVYSPGTPTYQRSSVGMQKGWKSERMPLTHRVGPALLPLNNVKALPSKWEDAERWIFSPASGDSSYQQPVHQHQLHRKPKAKSGPLGPPGSAYYSMYTPVRPMSERKSAGDLMASSPFSARLMETNGLPTLCDDIRMGSPARLEPWMPRSISLHCCSVELPDENMNDNISCPVSRRDIGTHISPASSANDSSFIRMSSACNEEQEQSTYLEIIDVQVDRKVTIGSLKNVHRANQSSKSSRRVDDCMKKTIAPLGRSTTYEIRITAWENLQKAKAEAAVQKLEMKLEKKKASSMEKIMKKLKSSQKKAHEMRKSMLASQLDHAAKPSSSRISSMYKLLAVIDVHALHPLPKCSIECFFNLWHLALIALLLKVGSCALQLIPPS